MSKRGKHWSAEEDALLLRLYADPLQKLDDIARALGRRRHAITNRANALGVRRPERGFSRPPAPFRPYRDPAARVRCPCGLAWEGECAPCEREQRRVLAVAGVRLEDDEE